MNLSEYIQNLSLTLAKVSDSMYVLAYSKNIQYFVKGVREVSSQLTGFPLPKCFMKYFEIVFNDGYSICIKASQRPNKSKVAEFLKHNMKYLGYSEIDIEEIDELSEDAAYAFYDMSNSEDFPTLK